MTTVHTFHIRDASQQPMVKIWFLFSLRLYNQTFKKHLVILPRKIGFYNRNSAKFLS